jgi:hypothetical protein
VPAVPPRSRVMQVTFDFKYLKFLPSSR